MRRLRKLARAAFAGGVVLSAQAAGAEPPRPNIVHILADDLGWGSVGFNGQTQIQTPILDALASAGMVLNNAYSATVCAPSRAMLYTGFHQGHARVDSNGKIGSGFGAEEIMTAQALAPAGYASAIFGKWGFGATGSRTIGFGGDPEPSINAATSLPNNHGFSEFYGHLNHSAAHDYYYDWMWQTDANASNGVVAVANNGGVGGLPEYTHDLIAARSEQFVAAHAGDDDPFYLQVNYTIPHQDLDAIASAPGGYGVYAGMAWTDQQKSYAAMITRMDASIGALWGKLDDPNNDNDHSDSVLANTLILFSSDNGASPEDSAPIDFFNANGPYRGAKRDLYEGGIHAATLAVWEGVITPGSSSDYRTDLADFMATAGELAGVETPVGIDGVSIVPTLTGEGVQRQRKYLVFEHHEGSGPDVDPRTARWAIVRQDGMKLVHYEDGSRDLFDLANDPSETTPLNLGAAANAQLAADLEAIAIAEGVQQGAVEFRAWIGPNGGALNHAGNWAGGGTPTGFWSAVVANGGAAPQIAAATSSTSTLGLEVRGSALQTVDVSPGATLTGRNEVRISAGGRISLADAALESNRWVNIRAGGQLTGSGQIVGDVYNEGTIAPGRASDLPAVEPPEPPNSLPPADLDTGVVPAVTFNFAGVQDNAPLTQTSALNPYASLEHGLDFGPGVLPRGTANNGNEFNVQGHVIGGTLQDAINAGDYLTFTIAPVAGAGAIPASASFTLRRHGVNAAQDFAILSSVGGFATSAVLGQIHMTDTNPHVLAASFSGSDAVFEPIEVRLYGWNAVGGSGNTHVSSAAMTARFVAGPTMAFDFAGVQDNGPVVQLAVADPSLQLAHGFDAGGGLAPRGTANAGDEFNMMGFQPGGNLAGAIASSDYVGFSVQAVSGLAMKVQSVTFDLWRNGANSATEYAILSSLGGFTAVDAAAQTSYSDSGAASEHAFTATFPAAEGTQDAIEFRLYGWNAGTDTGNTHFTGASLRAEHSTVVQQAFGPTGALEINGDFYHLAGATLALEIGGETPGDSFDRLDIVGAAKLAGDLAVTIVDFGAGPYEPMRGDEFTILTAADGLTGAFASASLPPLAAGLDWHIDYAPTTVTLVVLASADFDRDVDVDADDLARWQAGFGTMGGDLKGNGDADGNGAVDGADFLAWQRQLSAPAMAEAKSAAVPEPTTLSFVLFAAALAIIWRAFHR